MQPEVDCRVSDRLFENMTPVTEVRIEQAIRNTLQIHEPRIEVIDIIIDGKEDQNTINILGLRTQQNLFKFQFAWREYDNDYQPFIFTSVELRL